MRKAKHLLKKQNTLYKEKEILKKVMAITLLMTLTMFQFLYATTGVVQAVYEELENQNAKIENTNVSFNVYYKEEGTHSKKLKISEGGTIVCNIKIENSGMLNEAKIQIDNPNFKIDANNVDKTNIERIDTETNEIILKQMVTGEKEIELPIKFEKKEEMPLDYYNKQNTIKFTATYKANTKTEQKIEKNIELNTEWTEEIDTKIENKFIKFQGIAENKTMLEQQMEITSSVDEIAKEEEKVEIEAPELDGIKPTKVQSLRNGKEIEVEYDANTGKANIKYTNGANEKIELGKGKDTYKIIYEYEGKINVKQRTEQVTGKVETKFYGNENTIEKEISEKLTANKTTNIVSAEMNTTEKIAKQYFTVKSTKKAYIEESEKIEIPEISQVKDLSIETGNTYLENTKGAKKEVNMYLEKSYINKEELKEVFGEEAKIEIINKDGQKIAEINTSELTENNTENSQVEVKTEGENIVIEYPEGTRKANIKILGEPKKIGEIEIRNTKYFQGDLGITKAEIEKYNYVTSEINITNQETTKIEANTNLVEAEEKIEITMNNNNLGTTNVNKGVEIYATLKTKDYGNVLYKNPEVEIVFPREVKKVTANSIRLVYDEQLTITKAQGYTNENGNYVIKLTIEGEQTDYKKEDEQEAIIVVNADLELQKDIPSKQEEIKVEVKNEGYERKTFSTEANINAKNGVFTYSEVKGYKAGETTETIGEEVKNIAIEEKDEEKILNREVSIVNNNKFEVQNVSIEGKVEELTYIKGIEKENVEYSYEEEGDNWVKDVEDITRVKKFKLNIGTMSEGQVVKIEYEVKANLEAGKQGIMQDKVTYSINGQTLNETNKTTVTNEATPIVKDESTENTSKNFAQLSTIGIQEENEELKVELAATKAGKEFKDGEEISEGEVIEYHVKITNTTDKTISNIGISATQENAIMYNKLYYQGQNAQTGEMGENIFYTEDEKCKELKKENIELKPNETYEYDYEFSTKKINGNVTKGKIKITADGLTEKQYTTYTNSIKDSKIKVKIMHNSSERHEYVAGNLYPTVMYVYNLTDTELTNVNITEYVSEGLKLDLTSINRELTSGIKQDENGQILINIPKIEAKGEYMINHLFIAEELPLDITNREVSVVANAKVGEEIYNSNVVKRQILQSKTTIDVNLKGSQTASSLVNKNKVDFTATIKNKGVIEREAVVKIEIPSAFEISNAYMTINGERTELNIENNKFLKTIKLTKECDIEIVICTVVNKEKAETSMLETTLTVIPENQEEIVSQVTYGLHGVTGEGEEDNNYGQDGTDDDDDDNGNNSGDNNNNTTEQGSKISGKAWIDENKNGKKDSNEKPLSNLNVKLINNQTGSQIKETNTDTNGNYEFKELEKGKYLVIFTYDQSKYKPTIYQKDGLKDDENSDVIVRNYDGKDVAVTDVFEITDKSIENVDAGFTEVEKFDLSLNKTVTKITIIENGKQTVKKFSNSKLAKAEIAAKKIKNTTVLMEYSIKVTNEGKIAGKATEIVDYMPEDVTFDASLNQSWYKGEDGNLYTTALANEQINPGESKEVKLILTKKMTENNTGTTFNTAEIAGDTNSENIADIDSITKNKNTNEDDFSGADIIISIKTGKAIVISTFAIIILAGIMFVILRIRKEEKNEEK